MLRNRILRQSAFTLVELLIVVVILGILAAVVIPQFSDTAENAKHAELTSSLRITRTAINHYMIDHDGRGPHMLQNRTTDPVTDNFILRLTSKTKANGMIGGGGAIFGPYINAFPKNLFTSDTTEASKVQIGTGNPPSGTAGWFFNTNTGRFSANTTGHENF